MPATKLKERGAARLPRLRKTFRSPGFGLITRGGPRSGRASGSSRQGDAGACGDGDQLASGVGVGDPDGDGSVVACAVGDGDGAGDVE
jgi:hypothetical protein